MYRYDNVNIVSVVDGDTLRLDIDLGNHLHWTENFRLWGINAPEIYTNEGVEAKAFLISLLYDKDNKPRKLYVETIKPDKYGRWLAKIWIQGYEMTEATMINNILVVNDYAIEYMR